MSECTEIFTDIYARKVWGEGSGGGSQPEACTIWAREVSKLIAEERPDSVLSIGCGDGWADRAIDLGESQYFGVDVSREMILYCRRTHPNIAGQRIYMRDDFLLLNDLDNTLFLCKEVTQHLSEKHIRQLLARIPKDSTFVHCSATTSAPYSDIETGQFRDVWLDRPPFNLPTVRVAEWCYGTTGYQMEVWRP